MPEAVLHALPLAFVDVGGPGVGGDRDSRDQQIAKLRKREHAQEQRGKRQAVPQIETVERPAQRPGLRIGTDHRDHHTETAGDDAAQRCVPGKDGHHGNAEHGKREQLRRADEQHDGAQNRDADRHEHRAEHTTHQRGHVGGAQRASRLALFGHGKAVEHGCRRGGTSGHAEQDRGNRIAGGSGRAEPEQQRERRVGIHVERERQQHRSAGEAADARNDAEHQPHDAARPQKHEAVRLHQQQEGLAGGGGHEADFTTDRFHRLRSPSTRHARGKGRTRPRARRPP